MGGREVNLERVMWDNPAEEPLPRKEFIKHFDHLYLYGTMNPEITQYMDKWQQCAMRELYRAQNRMRSRE